MDPRGDEGFTADDIAYTFEMVLADGKRPDVGCVGVESVTQNGDDVVLPFNELKYNAQTHVPPTAGAATLFFNFQEPLFDDVTLRKAIAWTLNRQAYVDIAREGAS